MLGGIGMKDEGFRILGYVVVMYIIALIPIRRVFGITLLFVACSVFILLEKRRNAYVD